MSKKKNALPPWHDTEDEFLRQMLTDTGFFCRNVLGMNYDEVNNKRVNLGKGGVRSFGPHQDMVRALDDDQLRQVIVLMPRNGYKSSIVKGRIMREIVSDPDATVLLCMHDKKKAEERLQNIRDELLSNEVIRHFFGNLRGPHWQKDSFITSLRGNSQLLDPTCVCCARDALLTGGHFKLIIMDDIIDNQSTKTKEGVESSLKALQFLMPLRTIGGKIVDIGTLYVENDVHHYLLEQPDWHHVTHCIDQDLVTLEDGRYELIGEETFFQWLDRDFLLSQLQVMGPVIWTSQYKNRVISSSDQLFRREQFQPCAWTESMADHTGYILTDTADGEEGCFNVIMYVSLDERLRLFVHDLQVGHWPMGEFIDRFFQIKAKWSAKVCHHAELFEATTLANTFRAGIERKARQDKVSLNIMTFGRGGKSAPSKLQRIHRLQPRFASREVFICDSVPKTFFDFGKERLLWAPECEMPDGRMLPGGELVEQFIRLGVYVRNDIPDAMAMIDEVDKTTGNRFCFWRRPARHALNRHTSRRRVGAEPATSARSVTVQQYFRGAVTRRRRL